MFYPICEQSTPRNNYGTLTWHQGEVFTIPFRFTIKTPQGDVEDIQPEDILTLTIKQDDRLIENVYERVYTEVQQNMILFQVDEQLSKILRRGDYVLTIKLTHNSDEMRLISKLPITVLP